VLVQETCALYLSVARLGPVKDFLPNGLLLPRCDLLSQVALIGWAGCSKSKRPPEVSSSRPTTSNKKAAKSSREWLGAKTAES
jgi:hypothetical protein